MGSGNSRIQLGCSPKKFGRPVCSPRLSSDNSEPMQRIKVIRLLLQNIPVDALGVRELSLLMRRRCLPELGFQCRCGWLQRLQSPNILLTHRYVS